MWLRVCSNDHAPLTVMPYKIFFFKMKNCLKVDLFISCDDRTGKMLHNICISAVAMSLRWAPSGPWASCYLMCRRKQNKHTKNTKRIKHLPPIDELPIHIWYSCNDLFPCNNRTRSIKWRTVVKDREILTRVQQRHVSIWIYLKGRFCYQRGIDSTRQHMWKECLSHKNTLTRG